MLLRSFGQGQEATRVRYIPYEYGESSSLAEGFLKYCASPPPIKAFFSYPALPNQVAFSISKDSTITLFHVDYGRESLRQDWILFGALSVKPRRGNCE